MAKKIFSSGNYVIYQDDDRTLEFAKGYTVYSFNETSEIFTVRETVGGSFEVSVAELINNEVENDVNTIYDVNTFTTFLRENTGFKTAPGGSGAAPIGAKLMKTGQTTSYRTGDDGDIEAGRATNFITLATNNPFGNTNRFTDELGGQTYTNNIVIDWSTYDGSSVLGYRRTLTANDTLNNTISTITALNVGGFTGWRLVNMNELLNTFNWGRSPFGAGASAVANGYSPMNIPAAQLWTSTGTGASTAWGVYNYTAGVIENNAVGALFRGLACRDFTVTGTTLS